MLCKLPLAGWLQQPAVPVYNISGENNILGENYISGENSISGANNISGENNYI